MHTKTRTLHGRVHGYSQARAYAGRIVGFALGFLGGWYGIAAGLLIGSMVDVARANRALRNFLRSPASAAPCEPLPGLIAAAALALYGDWDGLGTESERRSLFLEAVRAQIEELRGEERAIVRLVDAIREESRPDLATLARVLALSADERAGSILADFAYALARKADARLSHERDEALRRELADTGIAGTTLRAARQRAFPSYREPWELLELAPGASAEEAKRAWRRLCRRLHPDALRHAAVGAQAQAETEAAQASAFAELKEAYEYLRRRSASATPQP